LKHTDWEIGCGHRCEEKPKVFLGLAFLEVLNYGLKMRHPTLSKMAVLKENPGSIILSLLNHNFSLLALTLPEGDDFKWNPQFK
jgi:hypothetical protein